MDMLRGANPELAKALEASGKEPTPENIAAALKAHGDALAALRAQNVGKHNTVQEQKMTQAEKRLALTAAKTNKQLQEVGLGPVKGTEPVAPDPGHKVATKKQSEEYAAAERGVRNAMDSVNEIRNEVKNAFARRLAWGTVARGKADAARGRLIAFINSGEGMTPGMPAEHQKLLEKQAVQLGSAEAWANPDLILAQMDQLEASLKKSLQYRREGTGIPTSAVHGDVLPADATVEVIDPRGRRGRIPKASLQKALEKGYKLGTTAP